MNEIILIFTGIIAAVLTYLLSIKGKQGAVRASALLSLIVGILFFLLPNILNDYLSYNIPLVFTGASFAGMASPKIISKPWMIGLSGLIFTVIYISSSIFFAGYGGGLGTVACISVLVVFGLRMIRDQ